MVNIYNPKYIFDIKFKNNIFNVNIITQEQHMLNEKEKFLKINLKKQDIMNQQM